jgi:uncharacterized protein
MSDQSRNLAAWQALNRAINAGDLSAIQLLIPQHPEFLRVIPELGSGLVEAALLGKLQIVKYLVEQGADINQVVSLFGSPLRSAASEARIDVIKYLLEHRAKLDVSSPDLNPMFTVIYDGHVEVARLLIESGIDCHAVYRSTSGTLKNALSYAQSREQKEIADLLLKAGCRLPIEGVDKPIWEPESEKVDQATTDDNTQQIISRMADAFAAVDPLALQEIVPVLYDVHVAINVIPPGNGHPCLTLFTTGMSNRPLKTPAGQEMYQYAELAMHLPADWPHPRTASPSDDSLWPVEWLRQLAYFPHLQDTWLGGKMTIISSAEPPVPLGANTKQTCLLLVADFLSCSPMLLENGKTVWMYLVYPIYTEERDLEKEQGMVALLQRLQERGYGAITDVNRENVALPRRKP